MVQRAGLRSQGAAGQRRFLLTGLNDFNNIITRGSITCTPGTNSTVLRIPSDRPEGAPHTQHMACLQGPASAAAMADSPSSLSSQERMAARVVMRFLGLQRPGAGRGSGLHPTQRRPVIALHIACPSGPGREGCAASGRYLPSHRTTGRPRSGGEHTAWGCFICLGRPAARKRLRRPGQEPRTQIRWAPAHALLSYLASHGRRGASRAAAAAPYQARLLHDSCSARAAPARSGRQPSRAAQPRAPRQCPGPQSRPTAPGHPADRRRSPLWSCDGGCQVLLLCPAWFLLFRTDNHSP